MLPTFLDEIKKSGNRIVQLHPFEQVGVSSDLARRDLFLAVFHIEDTWVKLLGVYGRKERRVNEAEFAHGGGVGRFMEVRQMRDGWVEDGLFA